MLCQFGKFWAPTSPCLPCSRYNVHRSWKLDVPLKVEGSSIPSFSRKEYPRWNSWEKVVQGLACWFPRPLPRALPTAIYCLPVALHVIKNLPHLGHYPAVTIRKTYHYTYLLIFFHFLNLSTGQHIQHLYVNSLWETH